MAKLPEDVIKRAREVDIVDLIERYGVKLHKAGPEYKGICPFHSEKSPSFTVTPDVESSGIGRYHCFGCGASGGTIQFVMDYASADFRDAVTMITGGTSATVPPPERRTIERDQPDEWNSLNKVTQIAPTPPDIKYLAAPSSFEVPKSVNSFTGNDGVTRVKHVAAHRWAYLNADGELIGYIVRFNLLWGGKEVIPQTWCSNSNTGEMAWKWKSFGKPRPMYGLELLAANPKAQVLVVEGEKACDAARALFASLGIPPSKLVVVSWPGGSKAIKHVDWFPLFRRSVAFWPDADQKPYPENHPRAGDLMPAIEQPGMVAMRDIYRAIKDQCEGCKLIMPPTGVPDGWDLADEAPEAFNLKAHMKTGVLAAEVFEAPAAEELAEDPPWDTGEPMAEQELAAESPAPAPKPAPAPRQSRADEHDKLEDPALAKNGYFRVLGYDHDRFYLLQHEKSQIMVYTKSDFSEPGLIELAPLDWWETYFPGGKNGGIDKRAAMNWLVRKAHSRGVYSMNRLRGRGGWLDRGRLVFHHGDFLTVDGKRVEISNMDSYYVYEMAEALPDIPDEAMTCEEGRDLLDLASIFRWTKPASAALMAGWVALAPIGGSIRWRPHIWLNGGAGSGKTTVLNRFVHHLMNGMDLFAQGNSTEAGLRQELKGDARPVLFDESESQTEREALRIQAVLAMIRQASSESQAKTYKGTAGGDAMAFHIRSMFCLASIQVGIKFQADIERMTVLSLQPKHTDPEPEETWKRIDNALHVMQRDETLSGRLIRRSLELLPVTLKNIDVFSEAAAIRFGSQRDGDQYGTLLAGAWSLISREVATREAALEMIDMYDWSEHRENNDTDEGERALAALMGALVRIQGSAEITVNELVRTAKGYQVDGVTMSNSNAEAVLQRHGMRIEANRLILSNSSGELRRLMHGTPFESDLRGVLLRLRGADRCNNRSYKFSGVPSKAISIPLDDLLDDDVQMKMSDYDEVNF
jgi:putative DNA primase/helicase